MIFKIGGEDYSIEGNPIYEDSYTNIFNCTKGEGFLKSLYAKFSYSNEHEIDYKKIYQITQNSKNQNLVPIYYIEYDPLQKVYLIIMEKCQENLEQQSQKFNETQIKEFLNEFLKGYKCLHDQNMFHGKINTNNIFIIKSQHTSQYKIGDIVSYATSNNNTNIGYIAPEIFPKSSKDELFLKIQSNQNQEASDIYSLGMVLIRLICGKLPFECTHDQVMQFHNLIKSVPYQIKINPSNINQQHFSEELLNPIQKMIRYNPQERLTFDDLQQLLMQYRKQRLSQTINCSSSQNHLFSTINSSININFHQSQKPKSAIQLIQKSTSNCFKNLAQARICPQITSIDPKTKRLRVIKRIYTNEVILNFIDFQWDQFKNNLEIEKEYASQQIMAENREFMLLLLNSYNNKSCDIEDNEIRFIYCLLAKFQGYKEIVQKLPLDYKVELLNV
ncbi:unnamed protein product (macronuclear) [Paramecium tetraurelia]|uniref:Protein kinase domain-containing protein n=1 Tax=Paramecium tetraurelia TaxID=5888 RepID=A0CAY2_PARTE|nr:uncharacterized protein GSPATT00036730001 [Paramecium tetraurelia]CAK67949.1 unnamed protein product [Paramecium tetraurelia]|eukprot:XP_001435346.1 hypothetical protein (macronuclear) [Paramecium tetraurelia strain d4-2]